MLAILLACLAFLPSISRADPITFEDFQVMEKFRPQGKGADPLCSRRPFLVKGISCQDLRQEFRYVVYVGRQIYCYWQEKRTETGRDFESLAREIELSITDQTTYSEHFLALRRWASAFHDGHVNALSPDDLSQLEIYSSPVRLELFSPARQGEKLLVQAVEGKIGEIGAGDEVFEVNGVPAHEAISQAAALYSSGSTEGMRRRGAARRLVDVIGSRLGMQPFSLKVIHKGREEIVDIPRSVEIPKPSSPAESLLETDDASKYLQAQILPGGLGYLRIDAFIGNMGQLLDLAMDRLRQTRGLVLDLRRNGGGDQSGSRILSRLIEAPVARYLVSPRNSDYLLAKRPYYFLDEADREAPFAPWKPVQVQPAAAEKRYLGKPVAVLIGPACFSACDTFVAALKAHGLAYVIGEPTGGGTGSPLEIRLPHTDLGFRYSVVRGITAAEEEIEGRGTQPDLLLEMRPEDRFSGRDLQLEAALLYLAEHIGAPLPPESMRPVAFDEQPMDQSPTLLEEGLLKLFTKHVEY